MSQNLTGPGQGLEVPQLLFPANLGGITHTPASNMVSLNAGDTYVIPRGNWLVTLGPYTVLQYLDPVTTGWRMLSTSAWRGQPYWVQADGFNQRVANLTGCPIAAVVTNAGTTGYALSTTTAVPSSGTSTWQPIVGGTLSISTINIAGSGYTKTPMVFIPAPPPPGIPATATATLSGTSVTAITLINNGAGYPVAPGIFIQAQPDDTNIANIVNATATAILVAANGTPTSGKVTGVICTGSGGALASAPTLTIAGASTGAAATPVFMTTATTISIAGAGTTINAINELTSVGGTYGGSAPAATLTNPATDLSGTDKSFVPRKASMLLAVGSGSITSISAIYDGGLFTGTAAALLLSQSTVGTQPTLTFTQGSNSDTIFLQQL